MKIAHWIIVVACGILANQAGGQGVVGPLNGDTNVRSVASISGEERIASRGDGLFSSNPNRQASTALPPPVGVSATSGQPVPTKQPELRGGRELQAAKIIARVGDQVILAGDLLGQVNQFLQSRLQQVPPEQLAGMTPEIMDEQRWLIMKQMLPPLIDSKLIYLDFMSTIPKDKLPEVQDSLFEAFDEKQLPLVIERANVRTAAELDQMLRSFGSSLDQQRRTFAEQVAAAQWRQRTAFKTDEVSHDDMRAYYQEHSDEFEVKAKARWEQLTALFSLAPTKEAAEQAVAAMGNRVWHGANFAAVAKQSSQGFTAQDGGRYDWTTRGSLRSKVLDEAIFTLPVGELSRILKDDMGVHIIRVVERQDATRIPFSEAQTGIKEKINAVRSEQAVETYVAELRAKTPVWTIFDSE